MAELADAQDLGSCEAIRVGSTPTARTTSGQSALRSVSLPLLSKPDPLKLGSGFVFILNINAPEGLAFGAVDVYTVWVRR